MGMGKRLERGLMAAGLSHGEVEARGHAISILFGAWRDSICNTYIVLAWNSRIERSPGANTSSDEPHTRVQPNRRLGHAKENQSQVPEAGDISSFFEGSDFDLRIF
ncbi:small integral membrane protein 2 [Tupaia chinensis]|uniref:small integral membrane protein 2 n=1 Tax=Tupaia chinensis TaxID=246437 RepID=UPI0003C90844|nr:small integral membrane protein 2 [Tupaia chinensis]